MLYVDHPVDHFYEPLAMDYFDGLSCNWSSNKKVQQIEGGNVRFENLG